jgi:peroxiredoxin
VTQLGQLHNVYDRFESLDTVVIAIAKEDADLQKHGKILSKLPDNIQFHIVADLDHKDTKRYHPTSSYLVDKQGVIRQIFPMMTHFRAHWDTILDELRRRISPS